MTTSRKYGIIYADPPWRYDQKRLQGAAEHHYSTMTVNDICSLPVQRIAEKDCVLFLGRVGQRSGGRYSILN